MKRRKFIQNSLALSIGATAIGSLSAQTLVGNYFSPNLSASPFFKLSLAQWSLHKAIQEGELNPYDFAAKAKEPPINPRPITPIFINQIDLKLLQ